MAERTLLGRPSLGSDGHAPINDLFFALIEQLALIRIDLAYGVTSQDNCVTLANVDWARLLNGVDAAILGTKQLGAALNLGPLRGVADDTGDPVIGDR